jgi:pyruvate formate lyase activating enzyme
MGWKNSERGKGVIFNIQRFSIHDGPGIRTTVFMKGCPLRCKWCSNPESINSFPELMTNDIKCIRCGKCEEACPEGAISFNADEKIRVIDRRKCNLCLECVKECHSGALVVAGEYMRVEEVVEEVMKDLLFYQNSGGGVTMSGGEPLQQWEFVSEVLKGCKNKGLHTALDTCGYAPWKVMEEVLDHVDLVLYDIKHIDAEVHEEGTGRSNKIILSNAEKVASELEVRMWLRFPLIPGYNDSARNVKELAEFAVSIGVEKISLLPYHRFGEAKYDKLGGKYTFTAKEPSKEHVEEIKREIEAVGVKVTVGN